MPKMISQEEAIARENKNFITNAIKNLFQKYEVMFIYFGGSIAYNCCTDESDTDINVFLATNKEYFRDHISSFDIFAYGSDFIKKRIAMDHDLPIYYKCFIDDKCSLDKTLIYLNPKYEKEYQEYKNFKLSGVLHRFLTNFYDYYSFFYKDNPSPAKKFYHVIRVRGQLENYLKSGVFNLSLPKEYEDEMLFFKANYLTKEGKEIYLNKIGKYLEEIKKIKEEI